MRRQTPRSLNLTQRPSRAPSNVSPSDESPTGINEEPIARPRRDAIRRRLLRWYDRNKRDLPWRRRQDDPYAQWVAEIMLQQTRVETVLNYYEHFLKKYPTIIALADADSHEVLKHWEGLGYYRRILHLHRAARMVRDLDGRIPRNADVLQTLPGVGEYTAAAIASIAYGEPVAAVDGNVTRVIARLFGIKEDPRISATKRRIRSLASALLSFARPGDFNQAWMDLGSIVCTPKRPQCPECPLQTLCDANADDLTSVIPFAATRTKPTEQSHVVVLATRDRKLFMRRRAEGGLWSGLWEFPTMELYGPLRRSREPTRVGPIAIERMKSDLAVLRLVDRVLSEAGLAPHGAPRFVGFVDHQLTHRSLRFQVYAVDVNRPGQSRLASDRRWVGPRSLAKLAVSTAHRRIHAAYLLSLHTDSPRVRHPGGKTLIV